MKGRGRSWTRWVAGAAALVIALAAASIALRPGMMPLPGMVEHPPAPEPEAPQEDALSGGVPSGQPVAFHEAILDPQPGEGPLLRLRFVAPLIGDGAGGVAFAEAVDDMAFLCREVGIAVAAQAEAGVSRIIVSLSAEETEFGRSHPDVVQYFEEYHIEGDECVEGEL